MLREECTIKILKNGSNKTISTGINDFSSRSMWRYSYNVDIIEVVNHMKNDQRLTTCVGISKVKGRDRRMHMQSLRIYNELV